MMLLKKKCFIIRIFSLLIILYSILINIIWGKNVKNEQNQYDDNPVVIMNTLLTGSIQQVGWNELSCEERLLFLERLIMINFGTQIKEAVDKYYEEKRGYDFVKITDVKVVGPYEYEMKIQISTYVGAHNPPLGLDVVTIHFKHLDDGNVVNYEHKDED